MTRETIPRFDLYGELEVSPSASVGAIEAAYRTLVKRHHPDVAGHGDDARIKRLNLAREWLTDPARRSRYDATWGRSAVLAEQESKGRAAPPRTTTTRARPRPRSAASPAASSATSRSARPAADFDAEPAAPSFGVNAAAVRHFLAELRDLDRRRAQQVWDGRAVAQLRGYPRVHKAARAIALEGREHEWQLAREAAAVIGRGKLGDTTLTEQVAEVLADVAGTIAVRDLLSRADLKVLLLPWTWRGEPVHGRSTSTTTGGAEAAVRVRKARPASSEKKAAVSPAPVAAPAAAAAMAAASPAAALDRGSRSNPGVAAATTALGAARATARALAATRVRAAPALASGASGAAGLGRSIGGALAGAVASATQALRPKRDLATSTAIVLALAAGLLVGTGIVLLRQPSGDLSVAGVTHVPATQRGPATTARGSTPTSTDPLPSALVPIVPTPGPDATPDDDPVPNATQRPGATPRPTPPPTIPPGPTPAPTTPPAPTPPPTPPPTPEPQCTVINLVNVNSGNAQQAWTGAGFTGTVTFDPPIPPQYKIGWQSLAAGAEVDCDSGIAVRQTAP